jgi:hypothetical protein
MHIYGGNFKEFWPFRPNPAWALGMFHKAKYPPARI